MDGPDDASPLAHGRVAATPQERAVVHWWRESRRWLAAILYAHKPREADVEDLMQDVAMRLVKHLHELSDPNDPAAVRPWLRTVAVNVARSAGRRTRSRRHAQEALQHQAMVREAASGLRLHDAVESAPARGARALEIAATLPPSYREPLFLSMRGLSQRQIAQVLSLPVTTIETRLIRARRMVREELEREEAPLREEHVPAAAHLTHTEVLL